jgi:hypothetical protein
LQASTILGVVEVVEAAVEEQHLRSMERVQSVLATKRNLENLSQ